MQPRTASAESLVVGEFCRGYFERLVFDVRFQCNLNIPETSAGKFGFGPVKFRDRLFDANKQALPLRRIEKTLTDSPQRLRTHDRIQVRRCQVACDRKSCE